MSQEVLSQAEIDAMIASAPPTEVVPAAEPERIIAAPPDAGQPAEPLPPRVPEPVVAEAPVKVRQVRINAEAPRAAAPAPAPLPARAAVAGFDPVAMRDVTRRIQKLEQSVAALRRSGSPAKRVESQVRALSGQVRGLQAWVDDVEARLPARRGRPAILRRSLWSADLYVDAAASGRWLNELPLR